MSSRPSSPSPSSLLDRLHLLVQIVLALRLLHLALHAVADLPLHLQHADFAFDQRQDALQTLRHVGEFKQRLLVRNLDARCAGDCVRQA
jgi:sirohydrochlorin ferrochelatase